MSGRSTSTQLGSLSESESEMSIGPGSVDSNNSLEDNSKLHRVIYEDSENDDTDAHSELDVSLYDTDEVVDIERTDYCISLGSDGFGSILSDPDVVHEDVDEEVTFLHRRNRTTFDSYVSGDNATPEYARSKLQRSPPRHLELLHHQNQRLYTLQRHQEAQIQEQQQRFPGAYEAASMSLTSFYDYYRGSFAPAYNRNVSTAGNTSYPPYLSRDSSHSDPNIGTNATCAASQDGPATDAYDILGTPPGDPVTILPSQSSSAQSNRDSTPFDQIYLQALQRPPRSMNSLLLLLLMGLGFGTGFAILLADPPSAYGYWLNEVGNLYIRLVHCTAVPMGLCQVILSASLLTKRETLGRLWLKTFGFYLILCVLSVIMAILVAAAFRYSLRQTDGLSFELSNAQLGFRCSNNKYLELNGSTLACSSDTSDIVNSTAAVFPSFLDVNAVLGLPESIALPSLTEYLFLLIARYVPNNIMEALSADYFISSMIIATILGVAISRSFRATGVSPDQGESRRNPLLRLFVHLYVALFTMLDWLQSLALFAILPITIGSILVDPANAELASFAGKFCLASLVVCAIQGLVLCPILFFLVTRRQPFGWLLKILPALLYSALFGSSMLPLSIATKNVLHSREVPPAVFGTLFPVLSACNGLAKAMGLPIILLWLMSYSDCSLPLDFTNSAMLFGYTIISSFGDTALPKSHIVYFIMVVRNLCGLKYVPPTPVALSNVLLFVGRLNALTDTATNLMLVRMAACTDEGRMNPRHADM